MHLSLYRTRTPAEYVYDMNPPPSASTPSKSRAAAPQHIAVGIAVAYWICTGLHLCSRCLVPCHCVGSGAELVSRRRALVFVR